LSAHTLLCFCSGDANGTIVAATQIEMVPITAVGDHYAASFDEDAAINAAWWRGGVGMASVTA